MTLPCVRLTLPPLLLLLCVLAPGPTRAEDGFEVAELPTWVEPTAVDTGRTLRAEDAVSGVHLLLSEQQVRVGPEHTENFHRNVRKVVSIRGVETGSQLQVVFSAAYERLRLHGLWRTRDGVRTQLLRAEDVKLLQQERALDERIYRDERTAVVFLQDVRVGDVLEEAYTLEEAHPLFRGHYVDGFLLVKDVPVGHLLHRVLVPESLKLHVKNHALELAPTVRTVEGQREYRWERRDLRPPTLESGIPKDLRVLPSVQVSSFGSWAEVAAWGLALQEGLEGSAELEARAATLRALPSEEARFLAAVRFVQDEVRYLGIEIGPNTHKPHAPGQVLAQRFGDCKDKALLLIHLLRALDIPAHMALVHSVRQGGVAEMHPSPHAFNHAIVRAQVAGRTEWVDATLTLQRGALGKRSPVPYARALVLAPGTTGLEAIPHPVPGAPAVDVHYRLSLEDSGSGTFHITTRYAGASADALRAWVAHFSAEQRATQQLDRRRGLLSHLTQVAPPALTDDEQANVMTMEEQYTVEKAWDSGAVGISLGVVSLQLSRPDPAEKRTFPLALAHPIHVRERWEVQAGTMGSLDVREKTVDGPASRFVSSLHHGPSGLVLEGEYQTLADRVTLADLPRHIDAEEEMQGLLGITLPAPASAVVSRKPGNWEPSRTTSLLISLGVLVTVGGLLLGVPGRLRRWAQERKLRKKVRPLPKVPSLPVRKPQENPEPSAPIVVDGSEEQLEAAIREQRCTCGGTFVRAPDILRLAGTGSDGPKLRVIGRTTVRLRCMSCETLRVLTLDVQG
jgi:transglutaminase-like putative cysteine protease